MDFHNTRSNHIQISLRVLHVISFDSALLLPGLESMSGLASEMSLGKENIEVHMVLTKMFYFTKSEISSRYYKAILLSPVLVMPNS